MEAQVLDVRESIYDKNKTMRLIGYQYPGKIVDSEVFKEIDQIVSARPHSYIMDVALNIFVLGYIYGKRAERSRRKKGK